jgi:activator of HSP90 ATPase
MPRVMSRREFSGCLVALGPAAALVGAQTGTDAVSHSAESIHQEVRIKTTARRVYEALTDAAQFTKVTTFSSVPNAPPARIGRAAGEEFSLFGGHIVGRHVELVPYQRIVQAWRVVDWDAGVYSIAKFSLRDDAGQAVLVFDHTGFPNGQAEHLAEGWRANYWEPLRKFLSTNGPAGVSQPGRLRDLPNF